jgi:pimeloyl-ACP methyl ester carboxylesterase
LENGTPASLPSTPVALQLAWVIERLDPTSPGTTEESVREHFAPSFLAQLSLAETIETANQITDAYGPVSLAGFVRPPTNTQALILVTSPGGDELLVTIAVEREEPHRITALNVQLLTTDLAARITAGSTFAGLIDIGGGRSLYLSCSGPAFSLGGPTVIFEAGHGGDSTVWLLVQSMLPPDVRSCSYDRTSDPAPGPRSGNDVIADLHALLQTAGVPGPYVLAGHSLGGLFVRLYASHYPDEVAGLILVDPSHEDQQQRFEAVVEGNLWAENEHANAGATDPEGFDFGEIGAEVRAARADAPLRSMPLIVLTRGVAPDASMFPTGWPVAEAEAVWHEMHAELAGLVPGGRVIVAETSGHFIQLDQPEIVDEAIQGVVAEIEGVGITRSESR